MTYWKEYPHVKISTDYVKGLIDKVTETKQWLPVRKHRRINDLDFEIHPKAKEIYNDPTKGREYAKMTLYAYILSEEEKKEAGVFCELALILKTEGRITPFVHKEGRKKSLNFPIYFKPGESYVGFYDDNGDELDRHTLVDAIPVNFDVLQWHTVCNDSDSARIVLACSGLNGPWENLLDT